MNKKEFLRNMWIHVKQRIPPNTKDKIYCWNPVFKEPFIQESFIAHQHSKQLAEGDGTGFALDRIFSHWSPIIGPEDESSIRLQKYAQNNKKDEKIANMERVRSKRKRSPRKQ